MEKTESITHLRDTDTVEFLRRYSVDLDFDREINPAILEEFKSAIGDFASLLEDMDPYTIKLSIALWEAIVKDEKEHTRRIQEIYDASSGKPFLHRIASVIETLMTWLEKPYLLTYESTHVL